MAGTARKRSKESESPGRRGREKHNAFFRLLEACAQPECPICFLARRRVEQFFDGLLYEKVNDPQLRKRFRRAGGFCNAHSFQFVGYHDGLAGSILYRDLLAHWLERPSSLPVHPASGVLPDCPACGEKARIEEAFLALTVQFLEDDQLKQALLASDGLCLPHLSALAESLRRDKRTVPAWLMEFQREVLQRIVSDLSSYCLLYTSPSPRDS